MNRAPRYFTPGWRSLLLHRCVGCSSRKARFTFRGRFYADNDHTLCPQLRRQHSSTIDALPPGTGDCDWPKRRIEWRYEPEC